MEAKKSGEAHLCHHDRHYEFCYDFDERVKYIKENKPEAEIPTRLRYFQLMPGLPQDELWDAYDKAWAAYNKARDALIKGRDAYDKACDALIKARDVYNKARDAYYAKHKAEIDKLHDELFPDCPWNEQQKTMFPKKGGLSGS